MGWMNPRVPSLEMSVGLALEFYTRSVDLYTKCAFPVSPLSQQKTILLNEICNQVVSIKKEKVVISLEFLFFSKQFVLEMKNTE